MKQPIRLIIHVPHREKHDYRRTLVGLKDALCVSVDGAICTYDLLPPTKPRKGHEHQIVQHLAKQLTQGWTLMMWDQERLMRDLQGLVDSRRSQQPALAKEVEKAWAIILSASDEQFVDLKSFEKFPDGHYLALVASAESLVPEDFPNPYRRLLKEKPKRPVSEDFWGVLHPALLAKSESISAIESYRRWVKANRPRPPSHDKVLLGQ